MAEAIDVRLAVFIAMYSNVRSLALFSDSLTLINLSKKKGNKPELFSVILISITLCCLLMLILSVSYLKTLMLKMIMWQNQYLYVCS